MHCIGMCGAIVLAYSAQRPHATAAGTSGWKLHTAYNSGRILSYALLGGIVGFAGMVLTTIEDYASIVSISGGAIMILTGFAMLGIIPLPTKVVLSNGSSCLKRLYTPLLLERTVTSKLLLGFMTPLLPCGLLYAMVVKAATAGNVAGGALTMATFGIGMAPSLMLLGGFSSMFSARMRRGAEKLAALTIVLMGVILVLRGMHVPFLGILVGEPSCPACEGN